MLGSSELHRPLPLSFFADLSVEKAHCGPAVHLWVDIPVVSVKVIGLVRVFCNRNVGGNPLYYTAIDADTLVASILLEHSR